MRQKIAKYIMDWTKRGYPNGIPNQVPPPLMTLCLAPSYKAICFAILRSDHSMQSLGFTPKRSLYYDALKRIEFEDA